MNQLLKYFGIVTIFFIKYMVDHNRHLDELKKLEYKLREECEQKIVKTNKDRYLVEELETVIGKDWEIVPTIDWTDLQIQRIDEMYKKRLKFYNYVSYREFEDNRDPNPKGLMKLVAWSGYYGDNLSRKEWTWMTYRKDFEKYQKEWTEKSRS